MVIREAIIRNYIDGYNTFDIGKMLADFDVNIVFENVSNEVTNLSLKGLAAFKEQAEQSKGYFSMRKQTILSFQHKGEETEIEIDYYAILAIDFPDGLKKGDELKLKGKSIFTFANNKIVGLRDIS